MESYDRIQEVGCRNRMNHSVSQVEDFPWNQILVYILSRELAYPTNVKGNSSSQLLSNGGMLGGYILPRLHEFYQLRHWLSPDALPFLELTAEKHLEVCRFLVLEADCQLLLKETGRPTELIQ